MLSPHISVDGAVCLGSAHLYLGFVAALLLFRFCSGLEGAVRICTDFPGFVRICKEVQGIMMICKDL